MRDEEVQHDLQILAGSGTIGQVRKGRKSLKFVGQDRKPYLNITLNHTFFFPYIKVISMALAKKKNIVKKKEIQNLHLEIESTKIWVEIFPICSM